MEQFTKEMMSRLDALAAKLGMAASAIWQFYLRQARVDGILSLAYCICTIGCMTFCLILAHRRVAAYRKNKDVDYIICASVLTLLAGGFLAWTCYCFYNGFTALYNPGYYAFQQIVQQLHQ